MRNTETVRKFMKCSIAKDLGLKCQIQCSHLDLTISKCEKIDSLSIKYYMKLNVENKTYRVQALVFEWGLVQLVRVKNERDNILY